MQANSVLLVHLKKQLFIPQVSKLFLEGPESKCFRLCGTVGLFQLLNCPFIALQSDHRTFINECTWLGSNKTLFTKTGS